MRYVFIADDFTGASDTLATLARGGLRVRLFRDLPRPEDLSGLDAWGIATDARALGPAEIAALTARLGQGLQRFQPDLLHVKICSTFDSSAQIGNVALFAQGLAAALEIPDLAVLAGQPSLGRYAVFGTLFARGPDGRVHRIDRHPVMAVHPVTPMAEADLTRHLASLGLNGLHLVPRGAEGAAFPRLYDLLDQTDVAQAGRDLAAAGRRLVVMGASSVAEAWLATQTQLRPADTEPQATPGPILAFAGSRSMVTAAQVEACVSLARFPVSPTDLLQPGAERRRLQDRVMDRLDQGQDCLVHLTDAECGPARPAALAQAGAELIHDLAARCPLGGLIVAGGDTSSAIVGRLAPDWLDYAGALCPGVPILHAQVQGRPLPLALKGGQMGGRDFFDRATLALRGAPIGP